MPTTDTKIKSPIVNILTQAQYNSIASPSSEEFYLITDDTNIVAGDGITATTSSNGETLVSLDRVVLYQDTSGSTTATTSITLSEALSNFSYFEIAFMENGAKRTATTGLLPIPLPAGNRVPLFINFGATVNNVLKVFYRGSEAAVGTTTITFSNFYDLDIATGGTISLSDTNKIVVLSVIGYR